MSEPRLARREAAALTIEYALWRRERGLETRRERGISLMPPTRIIIPRVNWHTALATAVQDAPRGSIIVVDTDAKRELGEIAAGPDRLDRPDLSFEVDPEARPADA